MQTRYLYLLRMILAVSDILIINIAFFASFNIVQALKHDLVVENYQSYWISINLLWLLISNIFNLYKIKTIKNFTLLYRLTWKSACLHLLIWTLYLLFSKDFQISRLFIFVFYGWLGAGLLISRFVCTIFENIVTRHYNMRQPVAVMGINTTSMRLATYFENNKNHYSFRGFLDNEDSLFVDQTGNLMPGAFQQIKKAAENGVKELYVSLTADKMDEAKFLFEEAEKQCIRLKFVPDFSQSLNSPFSVSYLGEFPVISFRSEPLEEIHNRFKKRVFDMVFSSFVIVFLLSWLYPILAIIIKFQSKGPVLFKQLRSGRDNKTFYCYKFRSMKVNDESDRRQASKTDERITPIGRFMRRTSIDELPQFFNVLLGNMSVIGPRPHMITHTEQYRTIIDKYMVRHYLKPGISGWAQVKGFRGETTNIELMEKRVENDIWYLENWSAMLDVKIIFLTIINIMGQETAY